MQIQTRQFGLLVTAMVAVSTGIAVASTPDSQYAAAAQTYEQAGLANQPELWRETIDQLQQFLTDHSQHQLAADASFFLAEAFHKTGNFAQSRQQYQTFLDEHLQRVHSQRMKMYESWARFRIGECAYLDRNHEQARPALQAYVDQFSDHQLVPNALTYLGKMSLAQNQPAVAEGFFRQTLERVSRLKPTGPTPSRLQNEAVFGLAQAVEQQGDQPSARQLYAQLYGDQSGWLADHALYNAALLEYRADDHAAAGQLLGVLERTYARSTVLVEARYLLGLTQIAQQQYSAAIETLRRADAGDPQHVLSPKITYHIGEAYRRAGDTDSAQAYFQQVSETWRDSAWAADSVYARMQIAFDSGDHSALLQLNEQFAQMYAASPRLREARRLLVRSLLKQKEYQDAIEQLESLPANNASQTDEVADTNVDVYLMGLALLGVSRPEDAWQAFNQIDLKVENRPSDFVDGVRVARGRALCALGRFPEAIADLQAYLHSQKDGPDSIACRADLVVALAHSGRLADALRVQQELTEQNANAPKRLEATLALAQLAEQAGDIPLAHRLYASLTEDGTPDAYMSKGRIGLLRTDHSPGVDQSQETLDTLVREHGDDPDVAAAVLARAQTQEHDEQPERALSLYELIIERCPGSDQLSHAVFAATRLYRQQDNVERASEVLEQFIQQHPQNQALDAALYESAEVLDAMGQHTEAISRLTRLHDELTKSDYWPVATYHLARVAAEANEYDKAVQLLDALLAGDAPPTVAHRSLYLKGQISASYGDWDAVLTSMRRLMSTSPENSLRVTAKYWMAEALYRQAHYADAKRQLDELAETTAGNPATWLAMIPLRQAQILAHEGKWSDAREVASTIATRFPDFRQQHEVDYLLGRCLASQGRFSEARMAYQRVISSANGGKTETAAMAQWMTGETFFHQKDYHEAAPAYLRVEILHQFPRWQAAGLLQAGKCYEMQRDPKAAIQLYARLLKQYPDSPFREEASRRLRAARGKLQATVASR